MLTAPPGMIGAAPVGGVGGAFVAAPGAPQQYASGMQYQGYGM